MFSYILVSMTVYFNFIKIFIPCSILLTVTAAFPTFVAFFVQIRLNKYTKNMSINAMHRQIDFNSWNAISFIKWFSFVIFQSLIRYLGTAVLLLVTLVDNES